MDPDFSRATGDHNFEFAFNSSNFSDRVLRIEIMEDPPERKAVSEGRGSKRRKEDGTEADPVGSNPPNDEEVVVYDNDGEEAVTMMEESPSEDEAENSTGPSCSMDGPASPKVISLYISSAILAAKSPFFYKLFSNGMLESDQRHATLRIYASEEAALMELLSFMYSNKLSTTNAPQLFDVLMAADKFEVASCIRHCSELLCNFPMTPETALLYLELPCSVSMASAMQPLTDAARKFLANRYKDLSKFHEDIIRLPRAGIEAILASDDLQVASEDAVYDLVIKWARNKYRETEERREVLGSMLSNYIRFPYMSCRKLKKVLTCNDLDHDLATKQVLEGLFFKAEVPHRQRALALEESSNHRYIERAYKYRPVKVVDFDVPRQQCIVYFDLKREECANLFPSGRVYSQAFHLGGQGFFLSAHCNTDQQSSFHCFGLFLGMQEKGVASLSVDYEFAARTKPTCEFASKYKGAYTFSGGKAVGYRNLFGVPWSSFVAEDSPFFINGTLHLRAELTIKPPELPS